MKKFQVGRTRTIEMVLVVDNAEVVVVLTTPHITLTITGYPQYSFTFCAVSLVQKVRQQEDCDSKDAGGGEPRGRGTRLYKGLFTVYCLVVNSY